MATENEKGRTDAELLGAWDDGDSASGNTLLERYFDRLLVFFGPRSDPDVEDLVQRTMMSCVRSRARLRNASSFRAFLFTIAKNELIDHLRRRRPIADSAEVDELAGERTTPSQFAAEQEEKAALGRALMTLELDLQIVVALHYWEGMTQAELTEVLELPLGTVKSRLRRAKEGLRASLAADTTPPQADATLRSLGEWAAAMRDQQRTAIP